MCKQLKNSVMWKLLLITIFAGMWFVGNPLHAYAAGEVPVVCGVADVNGNISEWAAGDFIANMYDDGDQTKDLLAKLYARYDPVTDTLFLRVAAQPGATLVNKPGDAFAKVGVTTKVDGNSGDNNVPPDFQWVIVGDIRVGWEGSFISPEGSIVMDVHTEMNNGGSDKTAAVIDHALHVSIGCSNGTVTINKIVVGPASKNAFTYRINGQIVPQGQAVPVPAGPITVTEDVTTTYTRGLWFGACSQDGHVTVAAGQNVTCSITNTVKSTVGGINVEKYNDLNGNGVKDGNEQFASGWEFKITGANNFSDTKSTNANGQATFPVPFDQNFTICEIQVLHWSVTTGALCVTNQMVTEKNPGITLRFGNQEDKGNLDVTKFNDVNGDGAKAGSGEPVLPGWTITLDQNFVQVGSPVVTNGSGLAVFNNLTPGLYHACETPQAGWIASVSTCVDLTVVDGQTAHGLIGNHQGEPTDLPTFPQPGQVGLYMPTITVAAQ